MDPSLVLHWGRAPDLRRLWWTACVSPSLVYETHYSNGWTSRGHGTTAAALLLLSTLVSSATGETADFLIFWVLDSALYKRA